MHEILYGLHLYLAPFGPTIAASIPVYLNARRSGIKELLMRAFDVEFKKIWLLPVLFLMPAIVGLSLLLSVLSGDAKPAIEAFSQPLTIIPAFFYMLFLGGPVAEEFGWRGYALGRLQARYSALLSSILLGIVWGLWHLPLFFIEDQEIYRNVPIPGFILGTIFLSILFTRIYNNTNGSILAVLLFHTTGDLAHFIFPAMGSTWGGLYSVILNVMVVVLMLIIWDPKKMVRERKPKIAPSKTG